MKTNRFTWLLQQFYMLVLASLMFWANLIRGFLLFGLTYSFTKTFIYLRASYYDKYREATRDVKVKFDGSNLIAIFMLSMMIIIARFPMTNVTTFILLVTFAYFILTMVYIIFKSYFKLTNFVEVMQVMMMHWSLSFYVLMILILGVTLSGFSKILFMIFVPGFLCKMLVIVFQRLNKKGEQTNDKS